MPLDGDLCRSSLGASGAFAMPSTNKELAVLIRDVVGARPGYGDESARPSYWPEDVPWEKGKSISQVFVPRTVCSASSKKHS